MREHIVTDLDRLPDDFRQRVEATAGRLAEHLRPHHDRVSPRRQVRVAPSFFDRLDELHPTERTASGVASTADFLLHEFPPFIDRLIRMSTDYQC